MGALRPGPAIALLLVLVLAATLRLAAVLTLGDVADLHGDEGYYVRGARSLAAGKGYPGSLRPPGYPAFLAAALLAGGGELRAARIAQVLVALAGLAALFAIVRARFGTGAASLSSLLVALHPTLISFTHFLWAETLVTALVLAAFWCLDRAERTRRDGWLAAAGAALGAAALARDMLLLFVPVVLVWVALARAPRLGARVRRVALVVAPVVLLVAPWMLRNQALLGRPFVLSTNGWFPIAVGNLIPRDRVLGMAKENVAFHRRYYAIEGELERDAFARTTALEAIAERQPWWIARKLVRNTFYLFSTASQLKRFAKEGWLAPGWEDVARRLTSIEAVYYVITTALGIAALWLVPGGRLKILVVALILFHWGIYVIANATHRFRVPLLPLLLLYVGPLLTGAGRRGLRDRWRVAGAAACLAAFAAVVATPWVRRLLVVLVVPAVLLGSACRAAQGETGHAGELEDAGRRGRDAARLQLGRESVLRVTTAAESVDEDVGIHDGHRHRARRSRTERSSSSAASSLSAPSVAMARAVASRPASSSSR